MNDESFLKRLFEGYVRQYRTLALHVTSTWGDITQRELWFFASLGERLGLFARLEDTRMDLSWHDPDTKELLLYLERETDCVRGMTHCLPKVLNTESRAAVHLVAILGWVRPKDIESIQEEIKKSVGGRLLLVIAWVAEDKNARLHHVHGWVNLPSAVWHRKAVGEPDADGYWSVRFLPDARWALDV
jgi:hypothetical protein